MKKNIIAAIAAFSLLTLTVSCGDDFVERDPVYSISGENYFNSKDDYENALIGVYDILQSSYVNVMLGEIASDNTLAGGESATDTPGFHQVDDMNHTQVNPNLRDVWNWMFAGVSRANYIMEFQDKTDFEGREQIIAQTRFLRAYFHFELVKWFGGIPMKGDARFEVGDETSIPRSTPEEVYASIEADLLYAIDNLPNGAQANGRVTVGAARALLGKAYLYWATTGTGTQIGTATHPEKYAQAAAMLETVIQSNTYTLVQDYSTIFENDNENNSESVFEIQYTDAEGGSFDCLQCSEGNVAVGFNGPRGFNGPLFESGYSFNVPVQEAYDAFEEGDLRRDIAILNIQAFADANTDWNNGAGVQYGQGYQHTGYFNRKYIPRVGDANLQDVNLTNPNNYRSIRYADVLLMASEAFAKTGDDTKALLYLNMVRERAFGDNAHNISATGAALFTAIELERRRELVGEGHRFFDLVRTGRAAAEITGFTAGKNEVFPIPYEEMQFSNGNWTQNIGY